MSTRCQVKVAGGVNGDSVTLYHHCDGYPSNMVPLIMQKAWDLGCKECYPKEKTTCPGWEMFRAGKVAGLLCAADPLQFEPEEGHQLHGDIEYFYLLTMGEQHWKLRVYSTPWDCESIDSMELLQEGTNHDTDKLVEWAKTH